MEALQHETTAVTSRSPPRSWATLALLVLMLMGAAAARIPFRDDVRAVAERQYRSATLARHFYFQGRSEIPAWRRDVLEAQVADIGTLEPSITEWVVSRIFMALGRETIGIARLTTTAFWTIGGLFVFASASLLGGTAAGVVSAAYFMMAPQALLSSLLFLPDPLMIMLFSAALFSILLYSRRPSWRRLVVAALACSLAILSKVVCVFVLSAAFVGAVLSRRTGWRPTIRHLASFFLLAAAPSVAWYGSVLVEQGSWATASRFIPGLLLTREYWTSTLGTALHVAGLLPILIGLVGPWLVDDRRVRLWLWSLWVGFGVFLLAFDNQVRFAGYYHLQLLVIVALSAAPVLAAVFDGARKNHLGRLVPAVGVLAGVALGLLSIQSFRSALETQGGHVDASTARDIGALVEHSTRTVLVSRYYGWPLRYHGEVSGWHWYRAVPGPIAGDDPWSGRLDWRNVPQGGFSLSTRLDALPFEPEYFIVTDFERFGRVHADLGAYLRDRCAERARTEEYVIFHRCEG
jgi:hypothetical protein